MFVGKTETKNRYIGFMFEVLVFVYENYWRGDACPELEQLGRKLNAVGFSVEDIQQALSWLDELNLASHKTELIDISQSALGRPENHCADGVLEHRTRA
jgi:Smg protein